MRTGRNNLIAPRPTWAEINLDNLTHNFLLMRAAVGPRAAIMAAVKADAYGHGAVACARALERTGADWFGVALLEEGLELRDGGITRPILLLDGFWEGQEEEIVARDITPVLFRLDLAARLDRAAAKQGRIVNYHLKVDTGMGRLGRPYSELPSFLADIERFEHLKLDGLMTHLAAADEPAQAEFTQTQISLFDQATTSVGGRGHAPVWIHMANSAGAQAYPCGRGNMVRLGGAIYGLWRDTMNPAVEPLDWRPVFSLHTRIELLKTVPAGAPLGYGCTYVTTRASQIATLPIGYADGMRRVLSNCGRVLVGGQAAPIVGRISMDLTIIDVTETPAVSAGDEVVLIGAQGDREITAEEVAGQTGTISYEITCGIAARVPRVYVGGLPGDSAPGG